jgi:methanogenic corrinoid protein MtbC1
MVHPMYDEFLRYLEEENRQQCVAFALSRLSNNELDLVTLYDEVLTPSMRERFCRSRHREICVWEEHVRSSIVRAVIECCYTYAIKEREERYRLGQAGKVIVFCPAEEYHELGARMVADFFVLCGFDAVFVGANTPQAEIIGAISYVKPKYVAISVTNYYNLVAARKTVQKMGEVRETGGSDFKIIVGGQAFERNPNMDKEIGADFLLSTFDDIRGLSQGQE